MELLRIEHLCKTCGRGESQIASPDQVNPANAKGALTAIAGFSGAGESALLHSIGGKVVRDVRVLL